MFDEGEGDLSICSLGLDLTPSKGDEEIGGLGQHQDRGLDQRDVGHGEDQFQYGEQDSEGDDGSHALPP